MNHSTSRIGAALLLSALVAVGCNQKSGQDRDQDAAQLEANAAARPAPASDRTPARTPARTLPAPIPREPAPPRYETIVVPAGTALIATLETPLSTATNTSGDSFVARTLDAIIVNGRTAFPAGATVRGVLRDVQASGRIKDRARMTLDFVSVDDARGNAQGISAQPLTLQARSKTHDDVEKIAGGGVLGAIIGGVAGGKKGAVIGAGAGAGAGTVIVLATKGHEVELGVGHRLQVSILSATNIQLAARN